MSDQVNPELGLANTNESDDEVERWLQDLKSPDADARADSAFALGGSRARRDEVLQGLRALLGDDDVVVVNFAAQSLGQLFDTASIQTLLGLLAIGPPRHRRGVAWAVAQLSGGLSETDRVDTALALDRYRRRARGRTREHADALVTDLGGKHSSARGRKVVRE